MGGPMCGHLLQAGYDVTVFSRTRARAEAWLDKGALWCDSPSQVAQQSSYIFTMVGSPEEVREVYFSDQGVFNGLAPGSVVVDMSTTAPSLSIEIAKHASEKGAMAIDAPVSGGDVGARNASLSIMAGGDIAAFEKVRPLFEPMAKSIVHTGAPGSGQHTKMCNQIVVAATMIGVCEALLYAEQSGLDVEQLITAIRSGAAGCWTLDNLAPRIIAGDDAPGFMVNHFIKDLGIALKEAEALNLKLPGLELAHRLYKETQMAGHGESGTQSLIHAIRKLKQ